MRPVLPIVALLICALHGGAAAQGQILCAEPVMPPAVDGAAAGADQMRTALAEARNYISLAGVYQECLLKEVEAAKVQAAAGGQPFEPMIETSARYKVEISKKAQEKASASVNSALAAYKNGHAN